MFLSQLILTQLYKKQQFVLGMFHILPAVHIGSDQFCERPYDDHPGPNFDYVIECRTTALSLRRIVQ